MRLSCKSSPRCQKFCLTCAAMWRFLLCVLLLAPALAEEPFSFDTNPGRLPKDVVPKRYSIGLDFREAKDGTFTGTETIAVEVRRPIRKLVFNSVGLKIGLGMWQPEPNPQPDKFATVRIETDDQTQLATAAFETEQPAGMYRLQLTWTGKLTEQPQGLYRTRFATPAGEKTALTTQMEAADARRMFPCWDEPAFRAVFELSAVVPEDQLAFSNMPLTGEAPVKPGWKEVRFAPTPAMASYLVAFSCGEFETLEDEAEGVHLRIITTPGKREQGRYAMEATKKILPYYNEYFGTKYPLPKLDQFCYPGFAAGGMENWGAIHYNDTTLLIDPQTATQHNRERVFSVVAHEIAHQWFGDLVTMGWWDNLWLNEGFASWMGMKATDRFNPGWLYAQRSAGSKNWAMQRDARSTTHPIQQPVKTEAQASEAFDEITYQKGESLLLMLESYLGEEAFRDGIRRYVAQHAYGNTTTADLWAAMGAASGKDVAAFARHWTEQPGFPVVLMKTECRGGRQMVTLSQERFTIHQHDPQPLFWETPVAWAPVNALSRPHVELLGEKPLTFDAGPCGPPVVINPGGAGYFRVQYDEATLARLTELAPTLPESDRLTLLLDSWALVQAGRLPAGSFFGLLEKLAATEQGYLVWPEMLNALRSMEFLLRGNPAHGKIEAWASGLLKAEAERLGWTAVLDESDLAKSLRGQIIGALGEWDDAGTLAEANRRLAEDEKTPGTLSPDLRPVVLRIAGQGMDAAQYEQFHARAKAESSWELKNQYYKAMGASRDPALAAKTLELSLTDEMPASSSTQLVEWVADSGQLPELAWVFARQHEKALTGKLASIRALSYLPEIARNFSDAAWADELETFAREHLPPEAEKSVAIATDDIRFKAEFKARFIPELERWIAR